MLSVRPALFDDFRMIEMDEATGKHFQGLDLDSLPEGALPNCFTAYWVDFSNVQVIYGIVDVDERAEMVMAVSEWIREKHPVALGRLARREVPRMIEEFGSHEVWAKPSGGHSYAVKFLEFIGFEASDDMDWWKCRQPL